MKKELNFYGLDSIKSKEWVDGVIKSPVSQFLIEAQAFYECGTESLGGLTMESHAKNIIFGYYPWLAKTWNDWLELELWAYCNYEEIGATGCASSGKSMGFSFLGWLGWMCAPTKSAFIISSTTKTAIRTRIWGHIKKYRMGLIINGQQSGFPCHLIDSQTLIQAVKGDDMHQITSVAVAGGDLEKALGNIQGRHPERMIMFVDEGEQTPDAIFSARFNLRGGTKFYRFITAANAVNPASAYGQFIEPKGGWSSQKDTDEFWETKTGICLHLDGLKSPNVISNSIVVPGLITREDVEAIRKSKGEDSMEWWMYVRGYPPMSGVRNTVLSWNHIMHSHSMDKAIWQGDFIWLGGLDPAFTTGGDDCVLQFAKVGYRIDGTHTISFEEPIKIKLVAGNGIPEDYQVADAVRDECNKRGVKPENFAMDSTAATSMASMIEQRWGNGIKRINFGAGATDRIMPDDKKSAKERCKNRVAEMWFAFSSLVRMGQVRGLGHECAGEFTTRQYSLQGEKYILESKAEMKARTGGKSPGVSDASVLCADLFRDMFGINSPVSVKSSSVSWEDMARKKRLIEDYR